MSTRLLTRVRFQTTAGARYEMQGGEAEILSPAPRFTLTPFVGRARELQALREGIDRAFDGRGGLWLIVGPAGIGKTRLADEVAEHARERGAAVLWGRCWEGEGAPAFWPWVQVLRSYARGRDDATLRTDLGAGADAICELSPDIRIRLPDIPPPAELEDAQKRFRLFDSVATFFSNSAARRPLVLICDDLHWADIASLRLLRFVASATRTAPVFLLGTVRDPELAPGDPVINVLGTLTRDSQRVDLRGLSETELGELIEAVRGTKAAASVVRHLHDRTEGNPFFATEIVRLWQAEGQRGATEAVPSEVKQTVRHRLARLSPACQRLLEVAAVCGREFQLGIVERVLAPMRVGAGAEPLALLDEATAHRLIETAAPGRYRFAHALVQETLYDELDRAAKAQLHAQVGEALESTHTGNLEAHLAELAHHFVAAAPGGDPERGIAYATRAAAASSRLHAYEESAKQLEAALQILDRRSSFVVRRSPDEDRHSADSGVGGGERATSDERRTTTPATSDERRTAIRRCELLVVLGESRSRSGDIASARDAYLSAIDLARRWQASELLGRAALGLAGTDVTTRVDAERVALLEEALAACGPGDSPLRARLLSRLATALYFSDERERRERLSREAVAVAERVGDRAALASALGAQHFALWGPDDVEGRLAIAARIIRLSEEIGRKDLLLLGHFWRVVDALELGDVATVDESLQRHDELAEELRQPYNRWRACVLKGMRALLQGRFADGEALLERALILGQQARSPNAALIYGVQLYGLRREQGRLEEIEPAIAAFAAEQQAIPAFRCGLALLYCHLGRRDEARAIFEQLATDGFRALPRDNTWLNAMDELAQVCAALGDRRRAAVLYDQLAPYAGHNVVVTFADACDGSVARYLGMLATMLSRWEDAAGHFEAALAMNARLGARPELAHTQREYAAMRLERNAPGDAERAHELLADAVHAYVEMGMTRYADEARQLLARAATATSDDTEAAGNVIRRQGDYWTIAHGGKVIRLAHAKGLDYLSHLLRHPGREFHVAELIEAAGGTGAVAVSAPGQSHAEALPDQRARSEYRRRLEGLRDEIDEAERFNDPQRATRAREEMEHIAVELRTALGLGGSPRRVAVVERMRKAVGNRVRASVARVRRLHPALGRHLATSVRLGTFCAYQPADKVEWHAD